MRNKSRKKREHCETTAFSLFRKKSTETAQRTTFSSALCVDGHIGSSLVRTGITTAPPGEYHSVVLAVCNCLIYQLLQRFCLLWGGYRSDNRFTNNIAVLINYICCRIGEQSGCEFSCLTF